MEAVLSVNMKVVLSVAKYTDLPEYGGGIISEYEGGIISRQVYRPP